jgi:hypothetical protein
MYRVWRWDFKITDRRHSCLLFRHIPSSSLEFNMCPGNKIRFRGMLSLQLVDMGVHYKGSLLMFILAVDAHIRSR